jgi:hypothetical protein
MYQESTQCVVKSEAERCPRCGEVLSVAIPGSVDVERVCICRSCAAVVTYGDVDVNGMSEAQALSSVPLSHRRKAIA